MAIQSDNNLPDDNSHFDSSLNQSDDGKDNDYTKLDETGYVVLDEENDREVASRGGEANYTQNVEAESVEGDDANIREGELPVQPRETLSDDE